FGLVAAEVRLHEIDFGLHRRKVLLRAALQDESLAQLCQIGNAGYVQEDVLGQNCRESSQNFLSRPTLALEVDDVRLHEDRAAIPKDGHLISRKGDVGVFVNLDSERFRGRLQEIAVAGGTLRIEFEIFYTPVFQDD